MNGLIALRLSLAVCFWSLVIGLGLGQVKVARAEMLYMEPYMSVMQQAVDGLRNAGVAVDMPKHIPTLVNCSACLTRHGAFGAYLPDKDQIVVSDHFDIGSAEGRAILVHEYGHYLLTSVGMPSASQEALCLRLGNSSYNPFFLAALEN